MTVRMIDIGRGARRQPVAGGPATNVVIGADEGWPVGVVQVILPPGAAMPAHAHGTSATTLIPLSGRVRIRSACREDVAELAAGTLVTIPIGERVSVENPSPTEARFLVVLAPPDFARALAGRGEDRASERVPSA